MNGIQWITAVVLKRLALAYALTKVCPVSKSVCNETRDGLYSDD